MSRLGRSAGRRHAWPVLLAVVAMGMLCSLSLGDVNTAPAAPTSVDPKLTVNAGDTAWMLISSALVMLMVPGLALFYGGMVRRKNVLGTIMHSMACLGIIGVEWVVIGYAMAFGKDFHGVVGWDPKLLFLNGIMPDHVHAGTTGTPELVFVMFQGMFAIITPALITGAFAERKKFSTFIVFILAWATLVYDPLAHWVWGTGGWLRNLGALDFAGGTVVHISSGVSALVAALIIGRRRGYGQQAMPPHNLPMTVMGASLLWFGWFGFNAGSALAANGLAAHAFTTTNTATAAAALAWMLTEWTSRGKPTVLGAASGAVAGLVAVTPAAGFVTPMASILIGAVAGALCYTACNLKSKLGYDDSLDVVGVHGVGGTWGALATGLFATKLVNEAGGDGLFHGNPKQFGVQVLAVLVTWVLALVMTTIILKVLDAIMGLRVTEQDELAGLDLSQHSETAYVFGGSSYGEFTTGGGAFAEAMRAPEARTRSSH
jgi:Amt family ammonium transporter